MDFKKYKAPEIIPTRHPELDEYVKGFRKQGVSVITSRFGRGRTILLCDFAKRALQNKSKVIFITMENTPDYIKKHIKTDQHNLVIKSFAPGTRVHTLREFIASTLLHGNKPDLVLIDAWGLVNSNTISSKVYVDSKEKIEYIHQFAVNYNCAVVITTQTPRGYVGGDDTTHAFDSISVLLMVNLALHIQELNYTASDKEPSELWVTVVKSRCSKTGKDFKLYI